MIGKKTAALFAVSLIIFWGFFISSTHAQQSGSNNDQIPSDLSLDLGLAQKDPAPAQKQIVQSQTSQAKIVTNQGEQAILPIKEEIPQEIKTQSVKDTVNPQQSTSEQVVDKTVEEPANPSETPSSDDNQSVPTPSNPASSSTDNMIPGTNIMEPDDNTAPQLPTASVTPVEQNQTSPTVAPGGEQSNPIPPENAPSPNTPDTAPPASNDNSAVQGVSISRWQLLLNKVFKVFKK